MLLGSNGRRLHTHCCSTTGGNNVMGIYGLGLTARRQIRNGNGTRLNLHLGSAGFDPKSGFPSGYRHPGCWVWPIKSGALTSANKVAGGSSLVGSGARGLNAETLLTGQGSIDATGQLILAMVAELLGTGEITQATALAFLQLSVALSGQGDLEAAIRSVGHAVSQLSGSGTIDNTVITSIGHLAAGIVVTGEGLTTANIADAIWGALAEGNFTYAQCLQIIAAAAAAKTSNSGQTFRDLSDTKDRIVGTVSGGERSDVTYNLD